MILLKKKEYSVVRKKEPSVVRDDAALFAKRGKDCFAATNIERSTPCGCASRGL